MAVAEALKHLRKASSDSEKIAALLLVSASSSAWNGSKPQYMCNRVVFPL